MFIASTSIAAAQDGFPLAAKLHGWSGGSFEQMNQPELLGNPEEESALLYNSETRSRLLNDEEVALGDLRKRVFRWNLGKYRTADGVKVLGK